MHRLAVCTQTLFHRFSAAASFPRLRYINANWVTGPAEWSANYIAAQGPTVGSTESFVRMCYETRTKAIIMTTNLVEKGKKKCERYWPNANGPPMHGVFRIKCGRFGFFTLTNLREQRMQGYLRTDLKIESNLNDKYEHFWTPPPGHTPPARGHAASCAPRDMVHGVPMLVGC